MKRAFQIGWKTSMLLIPLFACLGAGGFDQQESAKLPRIPVPVEAEQPDYAQYPGTATSPSVTPTPRPTRTPTPTPTSTPTSTETSSPTPTTCIQEILARICVPPGGSTPQGEASATCQILGADTHCTLTPESATIEFLSCGGKCDGEVQYQFSTRRMPARLDFDCRCLRPCENLPEGNDLSLSFGCGDLNNFEDTFFASGTCSIARCGFTGSGTFSCTATGEPGFNFNLSRELFQSCTANCYVGSTPPNPAPSSFESLTPAPSGPHCGLGLEIQLQGGLFCTPRYDAPLDNPGDGTFECKWGIKF